MVIREGNYRITSDKYQWMFQQHKGVDKHGKDVWDTWGYYPDPEHMIRAVTDRYVRTYDGDMDEALRDLLDTFTRFCTRLRDAQATVLAEL